jgi:hypothetical protein
VNGLLTRRSFALGLGALSLPLGCGRREPETPLAHLYGRDWVRGAFAHYAGTYAKLELRANERSFESYRVLAQQGVSALAGLQAREVPFYVRVAPDGERFRIERDVPERLTFSADMSEADRAEATRVWKIARDNIHKDYDEIQRLDHALTTLLGELGHVRVAIDQGRLEQFRITRQLGELGQGGQLPFELPYQVTRQDYTNVLLLLLERLESDRERLIRAEGSMVAVGLVVRATDAGSASLSPNVEKVLLAVAKDAEAAARAPAAEYPDGTEARAPLVARGKELARSIAASPEYQSWLAAEREREDQLGQFLSVIDQLTGLGVSTAYRQVMRIWRGEGDYLEFLRLATSLVPGTTGLSGVLQGAVDSTARYRGVVSSADRARALIQSAERTPDGRLALDGAVVNVGTRYAEKKLDRQLVFFEVPAEIEAVREELAATRLGAPR